MAPPDKTPFSLRPWPKGDKKPQNIGEFIARVSAERDGFRHVNEAELREQMAAEESGAARAEQQDQDQDHDDSASQEGGESASEPDTETRRTALAAREEFLRNMETAHQSAMLNLDVVSLLLSKENPSQAGATLSVALREFAGIGTLGSSKLRDSNITDARIQDFRVVGTGWRVMGIDNRVDSLVEAAERLEKEMALETEYWADVLAVSEAGWAITPLPRRSIGVRFGFVEADALYRDSGLAALDRGDDGKAQLKFGQMGASSQRLRAVVERKGVMTGRSRLPGCLPQNAPLPDRVLEARNTIFAQELWFEIGRESRNLLALGVRSDGDKVTYDLDADTRVIITLEHLGEPDLPPPDSFDHQLAEGVVLALQMMLIFTHRQAFAKRTRHQLARLRSPPAFDLLRSFISRVQFAAAHDTMLGFLETLTTILRQAGFADAVATVTQPPAVCRAAVGPGPGPGPRGPPPAASEVLVRHVVSQQQFAAELAVTQAARVRLEATGFVAIVATHFKALLPSGPADASGATATTINNNPLQHLYPPVPATAAYPDIHDALYYLRQATVRAVADHVASAAAGLAWADSLDGVVVTNHSLGPGGGSDIRLTIDGPRLVAETPDGRRRQAWGPGCDPAESLVDFVVRCYGP